MQNRQRLALDRNGAQFLRLRAHGTDDLALVFGEDVRVPGADAADVLDRVEFAECRIERIFVRETLTEAIRFSDWRCGRFNPRALEIREGELLVLIGDAIAARVFSSAFVEELREIVS